MKALRFILLMGGAALVIWGVTEYFEYPYNQTDQALPKMILGFLAILGSIFTKKRRS